MKKKRSIIIVVFAIGFLPHLQAQQLDLYTCLDSAAVHMPLLGQQAMMDEVLSNKLKNYNKAYLPKITASGHVSYQSVVPELPFSVSGTPGLEIPKVQYRTYIEVYQPLFDAGMSSALKISEAAQSDVAFKALEVKESEYKKQVARLFFQMLLVDDQWSIISKSIELMREREKSIQSAIENGIAQLNDMLKLKSEILSQEKKLDDLNSAKVSGMEILTLLTGINTENRILVVPEVKGSIEHSIIGNPELQLISARQAGLMATEQIIKTQRLPRVNAFGQLGMGTPNPLNFFEKDLSTYYMAGVHASWILWDWRKTAVDRASLKIRIQMLDAEQSQKKIEIETRVNRIRNDGEKLSKALERDEEIIVLKEQIRKNAAVQLDQGIITPTEYLYEVLSEQLAELNRSVDEIALVQNQIMLQFETGNIK